MVVFLRAWEHEVKTSDNPRLLLPLIKVAGVKYFAGLIYVIIEVRHSLLTRSIGKHLCDVNQYAISIEKIDKIWFK